MKVWDLAIYQVTTTYTWKFQVGADAMALSPDGKTLAITMRNTVKLWDVSSSK